MNYTPYTEKIFTLSGLEGLSDKQVNEHLKLYQGYVKNTNAILQKIEELKKDPESNALALSELSRRFAFEWNGMRLHELYFSGLGNKKALTPGGTLEKIILGQYGSFEAWLGEFTAHGLMRGIGWVILSYDKEQKLLLSRWVSDHEISHLAGLPILLAMDMWEHAYLFDYLPSGKKDYITTFFKNLNWEVIEDRFASIF
jgi:Fe-Mn family superoxide dismutase